MAWHCLVCHVGAHVAVVDEANFAHVNAVIVTLSVDNRVIVRRPTSELRGQLRCELSYVAG